jgi:autotransporter adhesin
MPSISKKALALLAAAVIATLAASGNPAQAQFICSGSLDGNAPVSGFGASAGVAAMACGPNTNSQGSGSVALGASTDPSRPILALGDRSIAVGTGDSNNNTQAAGNEAVAIGYGAFTSNTQAVAIGSGATSSGAQSTALGAGTTASGNSSVALGTGAQATALDAIAIGDHSSAFSGATANGAIAIGSGSRAAGFEGIAIGRGSSAGDGFQNVAIGDAFVNSGFNSVTIVGSGTANANNVSMFGDTRTGIIVGANATLMGQNSWVSGANGTAIGQNAEAGANGAAFGQGSTATGVGATAIGQGSTATFANSTAIGQGATTTRANQVAVGTTANTYSLAGVTSAASLAAQTGPVSFVTTDAEGNLATSTFTPASVIGLQSQVTSLQSQVTSLQTQVFDNKLEARTGTAIALAAGSMPALLPGRKFALSAGYGNYQGASAFGLGATALLYEGKSYALVGNVGGAFGLERSLAGGRGAVSLQW